VLSKAQDAVLTADSYQGCSASRCFGTVMVDNSPPGVTACDAQGCVSEAKLAANICSKLANTTDS
jgi:hypothetical protein